MSLTTFDQIQVGKNFKVSSGVVYKKTTTTEAKPIQKADGSLITNGRVSTLFYNSKIQITAL